MAQQPPPPPAASAPQQTNPSVDSTSGKKTKVIPSFLIIGTVFNEHSLSFPGVEVRIRESGTKKFKWEAATNSQGEFAVRVPPGVEYEVEVKTKKYVEQTVKVDAKVDVQQRLSIQLVPKENAKTGGKS
jgi:hypothetical protein